MAVCALHVCGVAREGATREELELIDAFVLRIARDLFRNTPVALRFRHALGHDSHVLRDVPVWRKVQEVAQHVLQPGVHEDRFALWTCKRDSILCGFENRLSNLSEP